MDDERHDNANPARDRHARLSDLVARARRLEPRQRASLLEKECAGDDSLREEVDSYLLEMDQTADSQNMPTLGVQVGAIAADLKIGRAHV